MIVFSPHWDKYDPSIHFHDVIMGRTIVSVNGLRHLLYMSVSENRNFCVFDKLSFYVDFNAARSKSQPVEISPIKEPLTCEALENQFSGLFHLARDWNRDGKLGFAI